MKNRSIILVLSFVLFSSYVYSFILALWGKPIHDRTGYVEYLVAFHLLAIINYLVLVIALELHNTRASLKKPEMLFVLHGSLLTLFPYNGYQSIGAIVMAAALISSAIGSRK